MKLSMRNKLLEKLIGDIDMLDEGSESAAPVDDKAPAKVEVLSVEEAEPEAEELADAEGGEAPEEKAECAECGGMKDCGMKDCKFGKSEDEESLGEDGLLPHERMRKLMKG